MTKKDDRAVLAVNSGVIFLAAEPGDRLKNGIHLLKPNQVELESALDRALASGLKIIWIHDSVVTFAIKKGLIV